MLFSPRAETMTQPVFWGSGATLTSAWFTMSPSGRWNVVLASTTAQGGGLVEEQATSSTADPMRAPSAREYSSNVKTLRLGSVDWFVAVPRLLTANSSAPEWGAGSAVAACGRTAAAMAAARSRRDRRPDGENIERRPGYRNLASTILGRSPSWRQTDSTVALDAEPS